MSIQQQHHQHQPHQQQQTEDEESVSIQNDNSFNSNIKTNITHSTMISVKDFAYDEDEDLHYGVVNYSQYLTDEENLDEEYDNYEDNDRNNNNDINNDRNDSNNRRREGYKNSRGSIINIPKNHYFEDGPPWKEDPDLKTPLIKDDSRNEFEFSIASSDEIHGKAIALFDFVPENDNEVGLKEGQIIWISYRHGQGWLVAEDSNTGETGLVPEEYVQLVNDIEEFVDDDDEPRRFLPDIITQEHRHYGDNRDIEAGDDDESDWVDEDDDELPNVAQLDIK